MTDYMKKRAAQAAQLNNENPAQAPMTNGIPNSALLSVFEGKTKATSEMMGHKENLAPSVAAKMSQAFGMNLPSGWERKSIGTNTAIPTELRTT